MQVNKTKLFVSSIFMCLLAIAIIAPHRYRPSVFDDTDAIVLPEIDISIPQYTGITEKLIVSPLLDDEDIIFLKESTHRIEYATAGTVKFDIVDFNRFQLLEDDSVKDRRVYKTITVRRAWADEEIVNSLDKIFAMSDSELIGYYDKYNLEKTTIRDLFLLTERIDSSDEYLTLLQHELLHSVGLDHVSDKDAIMNPSIDDAAKCVMHKDLLQICSTYICNEEFMNPCTTQEEGAQCTPDEFHLIDK